MSAKKGSGKGQELQIVTNAAVQGALAEICSPSAHLDIQGTIISENGNKVLVIESISAERVASVPILASERIRERIADLASETKAASISIRGRIEDGSALILDDVSSVTSLPVIASDETRSALTKLAANGGGEVTVRARVRGKGAERLLVLEA